jgi:hypothetical protein
MASGKAPQVGITKKMPTGPAPSTQPVSGPPSPSMPSSRPAKPKAKARSTTFLMKPGKGGSVRTVKIEFLFGLILLLLAPLANKDLHFDKNYVKRLIAFLLLFMGLFAVADSKNPSVSRIATGLGGLLILALAVYSPANKFSVKFAELVSTVVQHLQPK